MTGWCFLTPGASGAVFEAVILCLIQIGAGFMSCDAVGFLLRRRIGLKQRLGSPVSGVNDYQGVVRLQNGAYRSFS